MSKSKIICGLGVVVAVALSATALVCCKTCNQESKIGVLDNQRILNQSAVFQKISAEQARHLNALAARQTEDEKMLTQELDALKKKVKDSKKGEEAFKQEIKAFQEKVASYAQKYQVQQHFINRASAMARQQAEPFVRETLNELAQKGYSVILSKNNVHYFAPQTDVTAEFIKMLDAKNFEIVFPNPNQLIAEKQAQIQQKQAIEAQKQAEIKTANNKSHEKAEKK